MRGVPELNHPAFNTAAASLRARGFEIINPAEQSNDLPKDVESGAAGGIPRKEWIRRDIIVILDCDGVAVLPNWQASPGARLEVQIAVELERPIYDALTGEPYKETVLQEAQRLVHGDRRAAYGHPLDDYTRTAALWTAILGQPVTAEQAILCMVAVKISRECNAPKRDNRTDGAGYFECLDLAHEERVRRG